MKKYNKQDKKGFTIIEVVLVLAIAGLIFLMIFVAWPALNRSQRDAKRKDDISVLLKKLKDFQTNNRGALPSGGAGTYDSSGSTGATSWSGFYHDYLGDQFEDPNGGAYTLNVTHCGGSGTAGGACAEGTTLNQDATFVTGKLMIVTQATCDGETVVSTSNPRKVAVQYKLEGGGIYCANT